MANLSLFPDVLEAIDQELHPGNRSDVESGHAVWSLGCFYRMRPNGASDMRWPQVVYRDGRFAVDKPPSWSVDFMHTIIWPREPRAKESRSLCVAKHRRSFGTREACCAFVEWLVARLPKPKPEESEVEYVDESEDADV